MTPQWGGSPGVPPSIAGVQRADLTSPPSFARLSAPPLFITGQGRSGTSLTFDLLAGHPEVCAIFESWLLTPHAGVTGVFHQPQWNEDFYLRQKERIGHEHAAVGLVGYAEMAAGLGELVASWMVRRMASDDRYLVEKTPVDVDALVAMFPDALLVHVIRDGRDVAGSIVRASGSWAPEMSGDLAKAATHWQARVQEIRAQSVALGDRYVEIRFEDLRADARGSARRLFEFAGYGFTEAMLDAAVRNTVRDTYAGGATESGFRGEGQIDGWALWMTRQDGRMFQAAAGELLIDLGYAEDARWWQVLKAEENPRAASGRRWWPSPRRPRRAG